MTDLGDFTSTAGRLSPGSHPSAIANWDACIGHLMAPLQVADILCEELSTYAVANTLAFREDGKGRLAVRVRQFQTDPVLARAERLIDHVEGLVTHESLSVSPAWQRRRIGRTLIYNQVQLYLHLGYRQISLVAAGEGGGYAWARAGFEAHPSAWGAVSDEVEARVASSVGFVEPDVIETCRFCLTGGSRDGLWSLADISYKVDGSPLGSKLLRGTRWHGYMDLTDEDVMVRLKNWMKRDRPE